MTTRLRVLAAALACAAALVLTVGATGASAATTGTGHFGPEYFTLQISTSNPAGTVNMYGPVAGQNGTYSQASTQTLAIFNFRQGTVGVWHTAEPAPSINWKACTTTVRQLGNWRFVYGTGKYWGAQGRGQFYLTDFQVYPRERGHCTAANPNAQPVFTKINVQAWGVASLPRHH